MFELLEYLVSLAIEDHQILIVFTAAVLYIVGLLIFYAEWKLFRSDGNKKIIFLLLLSMTIIDFYTSFLCWVVWVLSEALPSLVFSLLYGIGGIVCLIMVFLIAVMMVIEAVLGTEISGESQCE